jgi:IS1 family transposase
MNKISIEKRAQIIACLVEGCSMRSTQRLTGANKKTVERLLVKAGNACKKYHDEHVRNLKTTKLQLDEIWAFIFSKQANTGWIYRDTGVRGDTWTWLGIDADSKLIAAWYTGSHGGGAAHYFLDDLQSRLANRVQVSTDGLQAYVSGVPYAFGGNVDFGQEIKKFETVQSGKYSPPKVIAVEKKIKCGEPDVAHISTSFAERKNLTIRMSCRRFTRLTNAFSKKLENHEHALALHFMHYNFCRVHQTLRMTPAMSAGLSDHIWEISELVGIIDQYAKEN